jgi:hypothetical protein
MLWNFILISWGSGVSGFCTYEAWDLIGSLGEQLFSWLGSPGRARLDAGRSFVVTGHSPVIEPAFAIAHVSLL